MSSPTKTRPPADGGPPADPRSSLPRLVLASGSPRRRELLGDLGIRFEVRPVALDESVRPGEAPRPYVLRLAREKAHLGAAPGELVLAADTTVVVDEEILGKPADRQEAAAMLRRLAGREHTVLTGVALEEASSGRQASRVEVSRVEMAPLSEPQIDWYVETGEPLDKAGAYAIQGLGALFIEGLCGNYSNVVGLPLPATRRLFGELGYDLLAFRGNGTG